MYYVYILKLENQQYYIGYSSNLKKRIKYHRECNVPTTARIKFEKICFYAAFENKFKALQFEKYLKTSSGYAFRNKRLI